MKTDIIKTLDDQTKLLAETICKGATPEEFQMFIAICKRTGLDPIARQIYAVKRWDTKLNREVMQPQASVDGFRVIAERSDKYEGQTKTEWCGTDGKWVDVWLKKEYPAAARVGVYKKGNREATYAVARWESYVQKNKKGEVSIMWQKMPDLMLAKCAECLALRKAFPNDLSGLYAAEEMGQADDHVEEIKEVIESKPAIETKPVVKKPKQVEQQSMLPQLNDDLIEAADPKQWVIKNGRWKGQRFVEINPYDLKLWCEHWTKMTVEGSMKDDLLMAKQYLGI